MATNYYNRERVHIGKRVSLGWGKCSFIWAIPPIELHDMEKGIYDETGDHIDYVDFLEMTNRDEWDLTHVGEVFC